MLYAVGTKVECMKVGKRGTVIRNKNILGLSKTEAMRIEFEDGTQKIYLANESECLTVIN